MCVRKLFFQIVILLGSTAAWALPTGNITSPGLYQSTRVSTGMLNFRVGFYGDYVFNRYLETTNNMGQVHKTQINTNAGYFAVNLFRWVDLFATVGESKLTINTPSSIYSSTLSSNIPMTTLPFESAFSWSAGGKTLLFKWRSLRVGVEGQYFQYCPTLSSFKRVVVIGVLTTPLNTPKMKYTEWQVALGPSYEFFCRSDAFSLVGYSAVTWSNASFDLKGFQFVITNPTRTYTLPDLQSTQCLGYSIGATALLCHRVGVTAEARFVDELALHVNAQFCF